MSNELYDKMKFAALLIAPTVVFISAVVDELGIPYGTKITTILSAFDVFVGSVVAIAKMKYDAKKKEKDGDQ